jgi:NAD(P)-dependent dehydrogenase (short-subunit alcohol dehydrogenase family)
MAISSPFGHDSTALEVVLGHDLSGKNVLITGASSGIGFETARALLLAGANVVMAVRDVQRGEVAARRLRDDTGNPNAYVLLLDLGSMASIKVAAQSYRTLWNKLDIMVNNAGVMATPPGITDDGFELQFGTNHLGHFALTSLLTPALLDSAPARVVVLSSGAHRRSDIVWDDIQFQHRAYDKWLSYGQSKTANALFAVGFNRRYSGEGSPPTRCTRAGSSPTCRSSSPRKSGGRWGGWMPAERSTRVSKRPSRELRLQYGQQSARNCRE